MAELPTRDVTNPEYLPCPWCDYDNINEPAGNSDNGPGPFDCANCHKAFKFDWDKYGGMFVRGIQTEADRRYLELMAENPKRDTYGEARAFAQGGCILPKFETDSQNSVAKPDG